MEAFLPKHQPSIPPLKLSFRAFCGGVRVGGFSSDRWSGVRAGGPANPCPPSQSLCSTPQRKCQVWPQEGAHRSQDKEIFRLSSPPPPHPLPPSPLITMIGVHFPCNKMQQNALGEEGGCHTAARLDKCLSFSQRGSSLLSSSWCERWGVEKFSFHRFL